MKWDPMNIFNVSQARFPCILRAADLNPSISPGVEGSWLDRRLGPVVPLLRQPVERSLVQQFPLVSCKEWPHFVISRFFEPLLRKDLGYSIRKLTLSVGPGLGQLSYKARPLNHLERLPTTISLRTVFQKRRRWRLGMTCVGDSRPARVDA